MIHSRRYLYTLSRRYFLLSILLLLGSQIDQALAQDASTKRLLRSAAAAYYQKDYPKAGERYSELLRRDSISFYANYGMGSTLYQQGKYADALRYYQMALEQSEQLEPGQLATALHNMGNIAMRSKQYDTAIELYQKALINTPSDDDTRYNLVLAQKLKKQEEQKQQEDKKQDEEQKQDKQEEQKQQSKSEQTSPPEQQNKPQNQQQPSAGGLTPEQAEQILNAFRQNDDQTRKRVEQMQREQEQQENNQVRRKW